MIAEIYEIRWKIVNFELPSVLVQVRAVCVYKLVIALTQDTNNVGDV